MYDGVIKLEALLLKGCLDTQSHLRRRLFSVSRRIVFLLSHKRASWPQRVIEKSQILWALPQAFTSVPPIEPFSSRTSSTVWMRLACMASQLFLMKAFSELQCSFRHTQTVWEGSRLPVRCPEHLWGVNCHFQSHLHRLGEMDGLWGIFSKSCSQTVHVHVCVWSPGESVKLSTKALYSHFLA